MSLGVLGLSWWLSGKEPTWQCRTLWFDPLVWGLSWWLSSKEPTCQCRTLWFGPLVGKIPWRRKWQPTPVFLTGKSRNRGAWWAIVHGIAKSQTRLSDWTTVWFVNLPFLRIKCILGSGFCTCRWCVCLSVCGLMYIWDRRKPFRQVLVDSCFWLNFPRYFCCYGSLLEMRWHVCECACFSIAELVCGGHRNVLPPLCAKAPWSLGCLIHLCVPSPCYIVGAHVFIKGTPQPR